MINESQFIENQIKVLQSRLNDLKASETTPETEPITDISKPRKIAVILDYGHGGIKDGIYTTSPSKMWEFQTGHFHDGGKFYEGVFNRNLGYRIKTKLEKLGFEVLEVAHESTDTSLSERISKANAFNAKKKNEGTGTVYVSIHGNASSSLKADGFSIFVYNNASKNSRLLATKIGDSVKSELPDFNYRKQLPTENYWEADFYVLRKTAMPAILSENGFFTNYSDASQMISPDFQEKIAKSHVLGILEYESLI